MAQKWRMRGGPPEAVCHHGAGGRKEGRRKRNFVTRDHCWNIGRSQSQSVVHSLFYLRTAIARLEFFKLNAISMSQQIKPFRRYRELGETGDIMSGCFDFMSRTMVEPMVSASYYFRP